MAGTSATRQTLPSPESLSPRLAKPQTIAAYIVGFPPRVQAVLRQLRRQIKQAVPDAEEAIRYDIPAFMLSGRGLISFAAWKDHVSIYPVPSGTADLKKRLKPYLSGKGTLQFPLSKPLPVPLIRRVVRSLLKDHLRRAKAK